MCLLLAFLFAITHAGRLSDCGYDCAVCGGPSWLVPVGGSRRGYAVGYARVGALAAGSPDGIAILWSWVG